MRRRLRTLCRHLSCVRRKDVLWPFLWGLGWEGLVTVDVILTADRLFVAVVFMSVALSIIPYAFWKKIQIDEDNVQWTKIVTMALGSGLGAGFGAWLFR